MNYGISFSVQTYRAIKILVYLAAQDDDHQVTLAECVEALGEKIHSLRAAAAALSQNGFTVGRGGISGGIRLNQPPEHIRLADVVLTTSPKTQMNICQLNESRNGDCNCYMADACTISPVYQDLMDGLQRLLEGRYVSDLLTPDSVRKARSAAARYLAESPTLASAGSA